MTNQEFNFNEEFEAPAEAMENMMDNLPTNETEAREAKDIVRETYTLKDGSQGSRAAFIRELFQVDNLSRKDIAEKYNLPYRVVYSSTVNMFNEAEPVSRGRTSSNPMIKVTTSEAAFHELVTVTDSGDVIVNNTGDLVDESTVIEMLRNEWIKEKVEAGVSRGDIAKQLDVSYGVIYQLTKDEDSSRTTHTITLDDGTIISRAAYIRQLAAEGMAKADIAKKLDVLYPVVWQALNVDKTDADKFLQAVSKLEAFADKVADIETFNNVIMHLKATKFPEPIEDEATEEAPAEAE